jgi:hypothetical protein
MPSNAQQREVVACDLKLYIMATSTRERKKGQHTQTRNQRERDPINSIPNTIKNNV